MALFKVNLLLVFTLFATRCSCQSTTDAGSGDETSPPTTPNGATTVVTLAPSTAPLTTQLASTLITSQIPITTTRAPTTPCSPSPCNNGGTCTLVQPAPGFLCTCANGYSGANCTIVSPCVTNPTQCNNRGSCIATTTSPFYVCNCLAGYTGTNCLQTVSTRLYPYGRSCNDQNLYGSDDGASPRIGFSQGFLFFGRYLNGVYVNMNGFLSFSTNYMSYTPLPFPHYDGLNADLLGPFWADADSSGVNSDCCGNNVVYYHLYTVDPSRITPLSACEQRVWDMALRDGTTYVSSNFRPTFVFVATWSKVVPWPFYYNQFSFEKNTFQAVLIMDGTSQKSLVSYRYDSLGWNSVRPAIMGYQTANLAAYNYPQQNVYQLANVIGPNSNDLGVAMFVTTGTVVPTATSRCLQWVANQQFTAAYLIAQVSTLPACPCSAFQAVFTPGYTWIPGTNCFVSTFVMVYYYRWPWGYYVYPLPYANKCCYERHAFQWSYYWYQWQWMWTYVWLGDLITTPGYDAGNTYMYNPLFYPGDPGGEDAAKRDCCLYSNNCQAYNQVRPLDTCARYIPPFFGYFFGDPHVTTLDGLSYDYNGIGEYWLLMSEVVWIQARTLVAWDVSHNPVNGSVFGAFTMQVPAAPAQNQTLSDRIFMSMDDARLNIDLLIIPASQPNTAAVNYTSWARNVTMQDQASDTLINFTGFILTRFNSGLAIRLNSGIILLLRLNVGMLSVTVTANPGQLGNNTGGLLGVVNGNVTDDLTLRNGTIMSTDSTPQEIYEVFGESWRINASETIMWYPQGAQTSDFQNTSFVPMFAPTYASSADQQAAVAFCGNNTDCQLDYALTRNPAVANASLNIDAYQAQTQALFQETLPTISGNSTLNVQVGVQISVTYTAIDARGNNIVLNMTGLPAGATFNPQTGVFTWTPADLTPIINLRVDAVGIPGTIAQALQIVVVACNCNGHGTCQFASSTSFYNDTSRFHIASCSCTMGYSGDDCSTLFDTCTAMNPCPSTSHCINLPPGQVNQFNQVYNCTTCAPNQNFTDGKCVGDSVTALNQQNALSLCNTNPPCKNGGTCTGNSTYYICTCLPGYTGITCASVYDPCSSTPCQNQGTCSSGFSTYNCTCALGFSGANCEIVANTCVNNPCLNGAACQTVNLLPLCYCVPGFTGDKCQTQMDSCQSNPCGQNGVCSSTLNKYTCTCKLHVTGQNCQTLVDYKIQSMLSCRVGKIKWSDDLLDSNKIAFTSNNISLCSLFQQAIGKGVGVTTFTSCQVVAFRKGSVYAITLLSFTVPSPTVVYGIDFANQLHSALAAYLSVPSQNTVNADVNSIQISVLSNDASANQDPCYINSCSDICFSSGSTPNCTCYDNRVLADNYRCRPTILPPSAVNGMVLAIALPTGVLSGVALVMAIVAWCYYRVYKLNDSGDDDEDEDLADKRRRHYSSRSTRDTFGFGGSDNNDWPRGDAVEPSRRPPSFLAWRLPSRVMGGEPRMPSSESANFRVARAYQPYTPGRAYQPFFIPAGGAAAASAYGRPALRRYDVADEPRQHQHHHHQHRRDDDASSIGSDDHVQARRQNVRRRNL